MEGALLRPASCSAEESRAILVEYLQRTGGCALCELLSRLEYQHLVRFGTASLEGKECRQAFYGGLGLCNWHCWELRRLFWGPGLAETLGDLLHFGAADPFPTGGPARPAFEALPLRRDHCWACRELARDEAAYVQTLVGLLEGPAGRATYEHSGGLCLPHVQAVTAAASGDTHAWVLRAEAAHWGQLKCDLAEFLRKAQPPLRQQRTAEEETAPGRCIQKLVGNPGRPWPLEGMAR